MAITPTTTQNLTAHADLEESNRASFGTSPDANAPQAEADKPQPKTSPWTDCWSRRRERKTSKITLFNTLPKIARQVQLQKRKKTVAGWTALFTGAGLISTAIGLGTSIKHPDPYAIGAIIGAGATGLGTLGLALFTWKGVETEEYHDLVAELDEAARNPEYLSFESDILSQNSFRPTWREQFLVQIAQYRRIVKNGQAWPDVEIGLTPIRENDQKYLLKDFSPKEISRSSPEMLATSAKNVANTLGAPAEYSSMAKFLRAYGKSSGGKDNVVKYVKEYFGQELWETAIKMLDGVLSRHPFLDFDREMQKIATES